MDLFREREAHAERRRQDFIRVREAELSEMRRQAARKAGKMKSIFEDAKRIEEQKLGRMLAVRAEADRRQEILAVEK